VGVATATDLDSLLGVVDYLNLVHDYRATGDKSYLIQEFLPDARDYRAMVVDGAYVGAVERELPPDAVEEGGWKHNVHRGAAATGVDLPDRARELAERTAEALGIDYLGVDLLETDGRLVVNETNARPTVDAATKYKPDFYDRLAGLIERTAAGENKKGCGYSRSIEAESSSRSNTTSNTPLLNVASAECSSTGTGSSTTVSSYSRRSDAAEMVSASPHALQGAHPSRRPGGRRRVARRRRWCTRPRASPSRSRRPRFRGSRWPSRSSSVRSPRRSRRTDRHGRLYPYTSRGRADPDKPSVHDRLRRRSGSCRRYAATLSIGRHLRDPLG